MSSLWKFFIKWIAGLIGKTDGYKTVLGIIVSVVGVVIGLTTGSWEVLWVGLGLMGIGGAHKAVKAAHLADIKPYASENLKEVILALIQTMNTIADITKERFNLDKFIKEHLDQVIALIPVITAALKDSNQVIDDLKRLSQEDEEWIILQLTMLHFPDEKAKQLTQSGVKVLLYLAQMGSLLK